MKRALLLTLSGFILLSAVLSLSACGIHKASEEPPAPIETPEVEQQAVIESAEPEPLIEEPAEELSAIGALAATLPPKPEIDIHSWEYMLANSYNSISEYEPAYALFEGQGINQNIAQAAPDFIQAARSAGFNVWCSTANRNYEFLQTRYWNYVNSVKDPVAAADQMLGPGLSDHQTGLALDFTDRINYNANFNECEDGYMKDTELYQWLVEHCAEYGFILRYPEGKEEYYGTPCQHPAHFRYVGKEAAEYIMANNLCLEEFIMLYDESLVFLPKP